MVASLLASAILPTTRAYFVGNSVTDALDYGAFERLFATQGRTLVWGRHTIPGTPLFLPWQGAEAGRTDGFVQPPFGNSFQAMTGYDWDVLTLEPFDRHERDLNDKGYDEGDLASALRYIAPAFRRNPRLRVLVYARWPRMSVAGKGVVYDKVAYLDKDRGKSPLPEGLDDWQVLWNRPYTGGWDGTNETKAYFERLSATLKGATKARVETIPVGHAMAALDLQMRAGRVPGYSSVWELYNDGIHLNRAGSYLVGCAFYAAITRESPRDLSTEPYGIPNDALARAIREAVARTARKPGA